MIGIFKRKNGTINVVSETEISVGDSFKLHGNHYEVEGIIEQRKERNKPEATQPKRFWANVSAKEIK